MRQDDLLHRGRGLDCLALGKHRFLVRLRARRGACERIYITYQMNRYAWTEGRARLLMDRVMRDSEFDYYQCVLDGSDGRLAYIFEAEAADGLWYYSEEGVSRAFDHSLAYYNFFQYPMVHECDVFSPLPWAGDGCVYQIFPERFRNGLGGKPYITCSWDAEPTPRSFFGGDLKGIADKLGYLQGLGVNCLYLTPVFPSPSNHKYDILDYFDVDAGFGGKEALRGLVDAAHRRGIRVLLDGVFNHCSSRHPLFQDVVKNGRKSPYYDWFFIDGDAPDERQGNYSMFASVKYMPRLNTGNPAVIDYFCGVAAYWLREFQVDGWRLDVCDELSDAFLRALRQRIKREKPDALLLGEVWHDPVHWLMGDMLDGVMNYAVAKACLDALAFHALSPQGLCDRLIRSLWRVPPAAAQMGLNLIGSHDTERFLTRVGGDAEKLKMGYAVAFFMPGMISVYYGDEVGMAGGYDPGCRRGFPWAKEQQDEGVRAFIQALYALKKQPALMEGDLNAYVENGMAVLERRAAGQTAWLYLNQTTEEKPCAGGTAVPPGTCRVLIRDHTGSVRAFL